LQNAKICGGTCAFFDHTQTATDHSGQSYAMTSLNSNTAQWASGFVCLANIDVVPTAIVSVKATPRVWSETVN
jgi:hypothetical protein